MEAQRVRAAREIWAIRAGMGVALHLRMNSISFVGIEPTDAIRAYAADKIAQLAQEPGATGCRLVLEAHHHSHGVKRFRAKFELPVHGKMLVVGARGEAYEDLYAAIDCGFDDARQALREHAAQTRDAHRAP